jgi:hypothetical protein
MAGDQNSSYAGAPRTPDLRAALGRQFLVIIACAILGAALGLGYSATQKATYESRATVQLIATSTEESPGGGLGRSLDVETQATVARSTSLFTTVGVRLGMTATQVRSHSGAEAAPTGDIMYLFFRAGTAERAALGAAVYTEEFLALRQGVVDDAADARRAVLEAQQKALTEQIDSLTAQIDALGPTTDADGNVTAAAAQVGVLQQQQGLAIRDLASVGDSLANIDKETTGRVVVDPRTAVSKTGLRVSYTTLGGGLMGLLLGLIVALLRDRNDDRYGSAVGLDSLGIHESGRVRYVPNPGAPQRGRADAVALQAYSRLLTRLSFSNGLPSNAERSVLLVTVETETVPADAAERVAETLALESAKLGIVLDVFSAGLTAPAAGSSYWESVPASIAKLTKENDLVLVPGAPLDLSATSLGLASVVRETVLLVSLRTPVTAVRQAIDDLASVDAEDVHVVVLTNLSRRARR